MQLPLQERGVHASLAEQGQIRVGPNGNGTGFRIRMSQLITSTYSIKIECCTYVINTLASRFRNEARSLNIRS
jgi:hypothetical protein